MEFCCNGGQEFLFGSSFFLQYKDGYPRHNYREMYKLTFRRFHLLFVLCFQPKHAFAFSLTRGRLQFVSFARGRHRYFWLHSPGDTTSFSSYFVVFGVLKMSPPKTPCFAPGPATRTSVAFLLKLLHRHAKHIMLVLGSFGQIG